MIKALKMMFVTQQVMQTYARILMLNPEHSKHLSTYFEQDHLCFLNYENFLVSCHGTVLGSILSPCSQKQAVIGFLCRSD